MKRTSMISQSVYAISKDKYDNIGKIIYINTLILVNTSFGIASQSITPQIAQQVGLSNLGQVLILIIYFSSMVSTIISPIYMKKLQYKYQFFIHGTYSMQLCLTGAFISYCSPTQKQCHHSTIYLVTIIMSLLGGFIQGGFWVAQNLYISECSNDSNRSLFFGISNAISNSAQMIGSLLSFFLLGPLKLQPLGFFLLLSGFCFFTQLFYFLTAEPPGNQKIQDEEQYENTINLFLQPSQEISPEVQANPKISKDESSINFESFRETHTLQLVNDRKNSPPRKRSFDMEQEVDTSNLKQYISARKDVLARRLTFMRTKQSFEVQEFFQQLSIKQQLAQIFQLAIGKKIRPLLPYMLSTGMVLGFEYGVFFLLIDQSIKNSYTGDNLTTAEINSQTFLVFGTQGIAEVFGGLIIGRLGQLVTINFSTIIQTGFMQLALIATFTNSFLLDYDYCIFLGFLWGFADCAGQANCLSLLSEDYGDDVRVFGVYNFLQNAGGMTVVVVSIILGQDKFGYIVLLFIIFSLVVNYNLQVYRRERKTE